MFTGRFLSKFAVKWILKIPPHLAYVPTLPCEILMSAKQGSVVTYLRCGGLVNNQIKKGVLLRVRVIFLIGAKLLARAWLSCALCVPGQHTLKTKKVHEIITFLLVTLPNNIRF